MTKQMVIRIDEETKERFQRVSRMEGKTASEKMRELIENYVRKARPFTGGGRPLGADRRQGARRRGKRQGR